MKLKPISNFAKKNILKKGILLLGAIFGFSTAIVAQYGAPMAHYKVTGTIKSKDCNIPIPNLKVKFSENDQSEYYSYPVLTDTSGKFEINFYEDYSVSPDNKKIKIIAEDLDGIQNKGDFIMLEEWLILKQKKDASRYNREYADLELYMDYKNNSPCKQELISDTIPDKELPFQKLCKLSDSIINRPPQFPLSPYELKEEQDSLNSSKREEPTNMIPKDYLIVYPNPTQGVFTIKFTSSTATNIILEIYDANSKIVLTEIWKNSDGTIEKPVNLENLAPGTYYIVLKTETGSFVRQLLKQ